MSILKKRMEKDAELLKIQDEMLAFSSWLREEADSLTKGVLFPSMQLLNRATEIYNDASTVRAYAGAMDDRGMTKERFLNGFYREYLAIREEYR